MEKRLKSRFNVSPSNYIYRELAFRGWKKKDLGQKLGIAQTEVEAVLEKRQRVSKAMAESLEKAFGETATFWLNIDAIYWNRLGEENKKQ